MNAPKLQDFTQTQLEEYLFPGTDAAVIFVAEGTELSSDLKEVMGRSSHQRWYPVAGGHNAMIPYHYVKGNEASFQREVMGWNNEHCDFCNASVAIGELCWTAPSGRGIFVFCRECHGKVPVERPWWKFWR
ncbi:MAG: hypothetical protein JNK23_12145 [Opitutaceae bacterium]|nr:hypothetical protein [Opitutaceae bacterium]